MMTDTAHRRLREATAEAHADLDRRADMMRRLRTRRGRRDVVAAFHRLHAGVEAGVEPWLEGVEGLDFCSRRRSPRLREDAAALGIPAARLGAAQVSAGSRAEALGMMYVVEGSTLGGQVIRRRMLGCGADLEGLSFLDPYGAAVGRRWRAFLDVLERDVRTAQEAAAAASGALRAFSEARLQLCGQAVDG